ncbi:MAG: VOC family protein [Bacteroidetes bacterium]|nr:VOC family protein [Bacteroidota bacterium]
MLIAVHPKLPMRDKRATRDFYINKLGFKEFGISDFEGYLMLEKDRFQLHFFEFKAINPKENYGQVYLRTDDIESWYALAARNGILHPTAPKLEIKPWGQKEFSVLDPDHNLLTFGQDS